MCCKPSQGVNEQTLNLEKFLQVKGWGKGQGGTKKAVTN